MKRVLSILAQCDTKLRWLIWFFCVTAWTAALLSPNLSAMAAVVLPKEALFSAFKALHVSAYALLTILSAWLHVARPRRWLFLAFLSAHAMTTEYLQGLVPLRVSCWQDVLFNHLGIALGLTFSGRWWLRKHQTVVDHVAPGADAQQLVSGPAPVPKDTAPGVAYTPSLTPVQPRTG